MNCRFLCLYVNQLSGSGGNIGDFTEKHFAKSEKTCVAM